MMVLRHLSATTATVTCRNENKSEKEKITLIPMDLSKNTKVGRSGSPMEPIPLNLNKNPFTSIPTSMRPLSSSSRSSENIINNNTITLNNNNEIGAKSRNAYKNDSPVNFSTRRSPSSQQSPNHQITNVTSTPYLGNSSHHPHQNHHHHHHHHHHHRRSRKAEHRNWRESSLVHAAADDDDSTFSSPDSGLHRDSPGEDDEVTSTKPLSPSIWRSPSSASASNNTAAASFLRKQSHPCLIPLSLIRAKYNQTSESPERYSSWEDEHLQAEKKSEKGDHQVQTKRARLEEMVSQIKTTKDRSRNYSGDDDTSSGGHVTSSDEIVDEVPTDLRSNSLSFRSRDKGLLIGRKEDSDKVALNLIKDEDYDDDVDEPCNLAYPKSSSPRADGVDFEQWKKQAQLLNLKSTSPFPLSPTDAAKLYGIDPDTYQQQIMQLQLTSAAMLGDPSGLLKALGSYPPWVYMGYYSQLLQSFQAQEILRQYAMQSSSSPQPSTAQVEKAPTPNRTCSSTNYRSQSPISPASANDGAGGMDSDGSVVGQTTPIGANGKRAPRAMTGRHVRTGTGASPSTLLTLRQKIEERQRVKAQQARQEALLHSQAKNNKGNSKYSRKPAKK